MAPTRQQLGKARRWVVKIGSALITDEGRGLDLPALEDWAEQVARLTQAGHEVVLVSSGAVAEGMSRLGWIERPHALHELQAAAAVGQMGLVQAYESRFQRHGLHAAQVLLTHEDLADRRRYLNARSTLRTLLRLGAIPVVNENDTVATEEIRFGDNDTLAALVCNLVEASLLVILTDQQGLFDRDPRSRPDAQLVSEGLASDPELLKLVAPTFGRLGRGGMATKLTAASRAARSGTHTLITSGRNPAVLERIAAGEALGTLLRPDREPMAARKQWIAGQLVSKGELILDAGAARVIREAGRSLLPVGVTHVKGRFSRGEVVTCLDPDGRAVARGLVNYAADEARRIMRRKAEEIESILGYVDEPELIHRDNLVLV
ncbi:glutamate 5-kinase [Ectothiorhodospira magna]|uniref:Glutamate 5-kinase n=1 Tax=Ectothiorhodospira magna TaxID=867345 RepID=A0A1H9DN88_9GAMM|nr:glutamate 5-kinase [Ectothiorhodospira magna]SEQ14945.1 glutamate 5-kinase [Ectothiorhodospira magna]